MKLADVLRRDAKKIEFVLKAVYNEGYNEGLKDGSNHEWHYVADKDYPRPGELVFCHGTLTTTYGDKPICEKSFIGYYKEGGYGWFIKNAVDGEPDQSWPVDEWKYLDKPVKKVEA